MVSTISRNGNMNGHLLGASTGYGAYLGEGWHDDDVIQETHQAATVSWVPGGYMDLVSATSAENMWTRTRKIPVHRNRLPATTAPSRLNTYATPEPVVTLTSIDAPKVEALYNKSDDALRGKAGSTQRPLDLVGDSRTTTQVRCYAHGPWTDQSPHNQDTEHAHSQCSSWKRSISDRARSRTMHHLLSKSAQLLQRTPSLNQRRPDCVPNKPDDPGLARWIIIDLQPAIVRASAAVSRALQTSYEGSRSTSTR